MRLHRRLSTARRLAVLVGVIMIVVGLVTSLQAQPSGADDAEPRSAGFVDVIKVNGLLDPIMTDFIERSVHGSQASGALALVLQVDSAAAVVSDARLARLIETIAAADMPVDIWVGPSGAVMTGRVAQLVAVADEVGMAPGTRIGDAGHLDGSDVDQNRMDPIRGSILNDAGAREAGVVTLDAPTIGDLLVQLPGVETRQVTQGDQTRLEPVTRTRFGQLSFSSQFMHAVASPAVTYLLLSIGLALLIFELFTAGVGVAGIVGAGSFVLACYGLVVLPTRWWAVALVCAAMFGFAVDVQTGVPRLWTAVAGLLYLIGSLTLFDGLSISWITLVVGVVGVLAAFLVGMPAMVRSRFSTPSIARDWLVGETGRAVSAIEPDGVVQVRGALWRACTDDDVHIEELDRVKVTGTQGLVLEVSPDQASFH